MKYCKKCLQTDTRPSIKFDEQGVCMACRYEESKKSIDWDAREKELKDIAEWAKEVTPTVYDCVIGVSGGKDSHFQALYAKEKLGLNPLLVCNAPDGRTPVGTHNIENLRAYGFDLIEIRPDPNVMRNLTKRDFFKYGNLVKSSEYSLWSSAYRVAAEKHIPLVIQGENPALTLGIQSDGINGGDALTIKNHNTLQGCNADDLVITEEESKLYGCEPVTRKQLQMFQFPSAEELQGIRGIFLQYYTKEWSQIYNAAFAVAHGLKGRYTEKLEDIGRYRRETSVDGDMLLVNQWLKYLKFGFGFCTDTACYDIREGFFTMEQAKRFVEKYDHCIGEQYIDQFCEYIGITKYDFYSFVTNNITNRKLFHVICFYDGDRPLITPKFKIGEDYNV